MKNFKKISGEKIGNLSEYIKKYIEDNKYDEFEIFIGTDSQKVRKNRTVWFASVICIYKIGKGAHVIYSKEKRTDLNSIHERLMEEINYSIKVALYLRENNVLDLSSLTTLHLDLSSKIENESNKVYKAATGWVKGLGFNWRTKPDAMAASYCADMCVRKDLK